MSDVVDNYHCVIFETFLTNSLQEFDELASKSKETCQLSLCRDVNLFLFETKASHEKLSITQNV